LPINPNGPLDKWSSASRVKIGAVIGGVIGGVAAVVTVTSITAFVRRRRRWRRSRPKSVLTFSTDSREAGELIVTPFDPYSYEAAQDARILTEQHPLVAGEPEPEVVALHRLLSTSYTPFPLQQPGTSVPVGLTDKEIARLRAEGFNPQQYHDLGVSSSNVLQSTSSPNAVPEPHETPYNPQRLHSEVESLVRREMERLHAEGLVVGAPPSYREGDA
jgi:hypothetical protein